MSFGSGSLGSFALASSAFTSTDVTIALLGVETAVSSGIVGTIVTTVLSGAESIVHPGTLGTNQTSTVVLINSNITAESGNLGIVISIPITGAVATIVPGTVFGDLLQVTGTTQEVMEFEEFTVSWSHPYTPTEYYMTSQTPGIVLYTVGNSVFAVGKLSNIIQRTIEYLDNDQQIKTVSRFQDLPEDYYAVTLYASYQRVKSLYLIVEYYDSAESITKTVVNELKVRYNSVYSNQNLKNVVDGGLI